MNKRWNGYDTTWICNTRPWSSFNKEGTVFVLLLPEEPAAELLAWPVEEEFGFLDLLILATVFTPPKSKQMRHLCHKRMKSEDIGNFPNKLRHIFGSMAWFCHRGVLTGFYAQLSIGGNRRKKAWITCICLQLVSSSFRRPTSSSHISKNSSFQVYILSTDLPSVQGKVFCGQPCFWVVKIEFIVRLLFRSLQKLFP